MMIMKPITVTPETVNENELVKYAKLLSTWAAIKHSVTEDPMCWYAPGTASGPQINSLLDDVNNVKQTLLDTQAVYNAYVLYSGDATKWETVRRAQNVVSNVRLLMLDRAIE